MQSHVKSLNLMKNRYFLKELRLILKEKSHFLQYIAHFLEIVHLNLMKNESHLTKNGYF